MPYPLASVSNVKHSFIRIKKRKNRCEHQTLLQLVESLFTLVSPIECSVLLCQHLEMAGHINVSLDVPSIVRGQFEETLYFFQTSRSSPFPDYLNLLRIGTPWGAQKWTERYTMRRASLSIYRVLLLPQRQNSPSPLDPIQPASIRNTNQAWKTI